MAFVFMATLLVPLLPLLINGAPFIGDSWVHLGLARDVAASGRYALNAYNERWPLINLLLAFLMLVTRLPELYVGQAVPFLAGLAGLPLYALCRRLGLSRASSIVPVLFLSFNPLYSYVTFSGAVMKETATHYLVILMLLLTVSALKDSPSKPRMASLFLVSLGVVFGHHYAGLVILLFLWALAGYELIGRLRGESLRLHSVLSTAFGFTIPFSAWNLLNYLALGAYFPIFNATDGLLLLAIFIVAWTSLISDGGPFSSKRPWLAPLAFLIAVMGLRGGLYILAQPVEPISIWEARNYLVAAGFSLSGLLIGLKNQCLKAYASAAVGMVLFAFLWGYTQLGFVLLIKSLHYFGPLLAVGAGFTAAALLRRGNMGRILVVAILLFLVYASTTGTTLALNGLGAYSRGEVEAMRSFPSISPGIRVYGDTRVSYLFPYASGLTISGLKPLRDMEHSSLIILLKPNWEQGFLYDYDWVAKETIAPDEQLLKRGRVYDSTYLQAWL